MAKPVNEKVVKVGKLAYFKAQLVKIFAPKDLATADKEGLMSKENFKKLQGIEEGANKYTHPATHNANMIDENETRVFVTPQEKQDITATKNKANTLETKLAGLTLAKVNEICDKYHVGSSKTIA